MGKRLKYYLNNKEVTKAEYELYWKKDHEKYLKLVKDNPEEYEQFWATADDFMKLGIEGLRQRRDAKRPKLATVIARVLDEVTKGKRDPNLVNIIRKQMQKAEAGDTRAAAFLLDRAYGMPTQSINVQNTPDIVVNHNTISLEEGKNGN